MLNKSATTTKTQKLIVYIVLALVTFTIYWQTNHFDFINLDDNIYVAKNSYIRSGMTLEGIRWSFSTTYADFWHPLTWLSLMVDYQLYGLNAGGYHTTNLILHILSTLLLFLLFCRMTKEIWKSAFVAAFFAIHPLHVESVAWISERKDVLSAFFWMLTLSSYVHYVEKPLLKRYLLVLFFFMLALMSKPMVVTLPLIFILLDYWPLKRFKLKEGNLILWQLKEKITFFVLSAACTIITIYAQHRTSFKTIPISDRIANAFVYFLTYLEKIFWPHDLSIFYPFLEHISFWPTWGSFSTILIISALVVVNIKRLPYLFAGWFWYAITILPVLGVTYTGIHWMHDTYTYLPSIGISVGIAWGVPHLIKNKIIRKNALLPIAIISLVCLAILSWKQCEYWKNSIELFSHSLRVTKKNYLAYDHRGIAYGQNGQYLPAIDDFTKAIDLKPDYYKGFNNRGVTYFITGQYQMAIKDYNEAISLKPDYAKAYDNRANVYLNQNNIAAGCNDAQKACLLGECSSLQTFRRKGLCY
ncbi:MAG: tetratricopeptide repeat protein [Syntrophaceae bacterium]|nr:tetratricopeptide repeat protein [Syntrophaceae bacterium]